MNNFMPEVQHLVFETVPLLLARIDQHTKETLEPIISKDEGPFIGFLAIPKNVDGRYTFFQIGLARVKQFVDVQHDNPIHNVVAVYLKTREGREKMAASFKVGWQGGKNLIDCDCKSEDPAPVRKPHTDRTIEPSPRENKTLTLVRELGFDCVMDGCSSKTTERIFFLGPQMLAGREEGAHATEAAIKEFIRYWENQIEVARDYLLNDREARTHLWTKTCRPERETKP